MRNETPLQRGEIPRHIGAANRIIRNRDEMDRRAMRFLAVLLAVNVVIWIMIAIEKAHR
jgi:hypothetical protein